MRLGEGKVTSLLDGVARTKLRGREETCAVLIDSCCDWLLMQNKMGMRYLNPVQKGTVWPGVGIGLQAIVSLFLGSHQ
jgi:hypothetical protein